MGVETLKKSWPDQEAQRTMYFFFWKQHV